MSYPLPAQFAIPNPPSHLAPQHLNEWLSSAVDPSLINLNVRSLTGDEAYDYLLYGLPGTERRNDGRLRDQWLFRYRHLEEGGWWISGLDPHHHWQSMDWGRFKPDAPLANCNKGKAIKYESPPKVPNRVTYFDVPEPIWDKVARRYGIKRYHSPLALRLQDRTEPPNFWEWVQQHPEIPITLTEGEKKAASLLSQGFVAIALPGIWNGRVGKKDFNERLHPDLLPLAQAGRTFTICFDFETQAKTQFAVYQATCRTAQAIEAAGCRCSIASLPGPEKGVDDFINARGKDAPQLLEAILDDALSLPEYRKRWPKRQRGLSHKYPPNVTVKVPYLSLKSSGLSLSSEFRDGYAAANAGQGSEFSSPLEYQVLSPQLGTGYTVADDELKADIDVGKDDFFKTKKGNVELPESGLVVISSDMGTGKTELMRQWRDQHPDARFLNNGHRVNLLKNLSQRLDTEIYSALRQGHLAHAQALSITVDSLYKLQTEANIYDCVFIDEACQYLAHLLHSKTCTEHRAEILEVLEYLIGSAKLVVLADAHMDDVTVDFFRALRPASEQPFIIQNRYQNGGRTIYLYESDESSVLVAKIFAALMLGLKIMVVSDSKRFIKKLEQMMAVKLVNAQSSPDESQTNPHPPVKVWSIHAENSGSEENIAFIQDITHQVKNVDALLTSPSLSTGVDIAEYHFDAVFGVFHGVSQTATECAQALHRYRPKVPTHIWVAPRPPFGYKETNAQKIKERLLQSNAMTAFLMRIDKETGQRGVEKDWALDAYCQIEAQRHQSLNNLRQDLRQLLEDMGHEIIPVAAGRDEATAQQLKQAGQALDAQHMAAVARANSITQSEYLSRQSQDYLKPEEVYECEKYRITQAYGLPLTEALVERDQGGHLIKQLAALEALVSPSEGSITDPTTGKTYPAPPQVVMKRDLNERDRLPLCFDWRNYSSQWLARTILGLPSILQRLIEGEEVTATDPDVVQMRDIAMPCRAHLKAILGFTLPANCTPMWLLGVLLDQLGLKLVSRKQGARGAQVKLHRLREEELTFALTVLGYRQQQRQEKEAKAAREREERACEAAQRQSLYGVSPPESPVSTPPQKRGSLPLEEGVNTQKNPPQSQTKSRYVFWLRDKIQTWWQRGEASNWRERWQELQETVLGCAQSLLGTLLAF